MLDVGMNIYPHRLPMSARESAHHLCVVAVAGDSMAVVIIS